MSQMPQITARELVRFLKKQVFQEDRQEDSHLTLRHDERKVSVTIPMHTGCDLRRGLAIRILKDAGFSVDDYLRLECLIPVRGRFDGQAKEDGTVTVRNRDDASQQRISKEQCLQYLRDILNTR